MAYRDQAFGAFHWLSSGCPASATAVGSWLDLEIETFYQPELDLLFQRDLR